MKWTILIFILLGGFPSYIKAQPSELEERDFYEEGLRKGCAKALASTMGTASSIAGEWEEGAMEEHAEAVSPSSASGAPQGMRFHIYIKGGWAHVNRGISHQPLPCLALSVKGDIQKEISCLFGWGFLLDVCKPIPTTLGETIRTLSLWIPLDADLKGLSALGLYTNLEKLNLFLMREKGMHSADSLERESLIKEQTTKMLDEVFGEKEITLKVEVENPPFEGVAL